MRESHLRYEPMGIRIGAVVTPDQSVVTTVKATKLEVGVAGRSITDLNLFSEPHHTKIALWSSGSICQLCDEGLTRPNRGWRDKALSTPGVFFH